MYTKAATTVMAISLAACSFAYAQGQGYGNDRGRNDNDRRDDYARQNDRRGDYARQNDRRADQYRGHANNEWRGQEWRRGDRLPAEYRHRQYMVNDWQEHHLSAPPRGYHWVQHGNDYVLVAVASGVIADLLLNHQ